VLRGKGLLTALQRAFLALFAELPDQNQFVLTGGTALAEFYLGHRLSFDLDLFTGQNRLITPMAYQVERRCADAGLDVTVTRRFATYVEYLIVEAGATIKVDMALDSPFRFEPPVLSEHGVYVNDYFDLRVDKLLAYYGRAEPRDAIDLYFILQRDPMQSLVELAAKKDPGFDAYWMAVALDGAGSFPDELDRWPVQMLVACDPREVKATFRRLAIELMNQATGQ
jgi:predicted nucleotidyltransferase component of viral defense system